jgi:hypothetical protein
MTKTDNLGPGKLTAINNGGMVELIGKDDIMAPHEGRNDADVCHIAAAEEKGSLLAFKTGNLLFKLVMEGKIATHQAGGTTAGPILIEALSTAGYDLGMTGKGQIIV